MGRHGKTSGYVGKHRKPVSDARKRAADEFAEAGGKKATRKGDKKSGKK